MALQTLEYLIFGIIITFRMHILFHNNNNFQIEIPHKNRENIRSKAIADMLLNGFEIYVGAKRNGTQMLNSSPRKHFTSQWNFPERKQKILFK